MQARSKVGVVGSNVYSLPELYASGNKFAWVIIFSHSDSGKLFFLHLVLFDIGSQVLESAKYNLS